MAGQAMPRQNMHAFQVYVIDLIAEGKVCVSLCGSSERSERVAISKKLETDPQHIVFKAGGNNLKLTDLLGVIDVGADTGAGVIRAYLNDTNIGCIGG